MKIFKTFKELKEAPKEIQEKVISWIADEDCATIDDIDFMWYFGGWIYLIETMEDVEHVPSTVENPDDLNASVRPDLGGFYNIIEAEADYDVAEWNEDKCPKYVTEHDIEICPRYFLLISITSDSGGTAYFVPEIIAKQVTNIMKMIKQIEDEKCL